MRHLIPRKLPLKAARLHRAAIVVSKVDRLTRSVAFLSRLLEANVDVRFADLPQIEGPTGRFMLQQMASVAELWSVSSARSGRPTHIRQSNQSSVPYLVMAGRG